MNFNQFKSAPPEPAKQPPLLASAGVDTETEVELYMLRNGWCPICSYPVAEDTDKRNIHISTYTCKADFLHIFEVDHATGTVTSLS